MNNNDEDLETNDNEGSEAHFKKAPKNPRASARARLRRRIAWLQSALHNVEAAIEEVFEAPGQTYKKAELEGIKQAINDFRSAAGLSGDGLPQIELLPDDALNRFFFLQPHLREYEANTAPLAASLGLTASDDDPAKPPNL